jgi:hypothetical protein
MGRTVICLLLAATAGLSAGFDLRQHQALQESLSRVHPRFRAAWLKEHGLDDSYYTTFHKPVTDSGLRCVGRWPWGPSWELCGRDSLLFLGSGSGIRILSISDSTHPRQLAQVAGPGLVSQVQVHDSLLFVACGYSGTRIYSISDPANPRELGLLDAVTADLCISDTVCYIVGGGSLCVFSIADPLAPVRLSALADSNELVAVHGLDCPRYCGHGVRRVTA